MISLVMDAFYQGLLDGTVSKRDLSSLSFHQHASQNDLCPRWGGMEVPGERLSFLQCIVFLWDAARLDNHEPVVFSRFHFWRSQVRRETSSGDSGTEILHKSENPISDSLEVSEVGELSSRDDWFNGLSRGDSGQVADLSFFLGHGLREHSRLLWPLRRVKL